MIPSTRNQSRLAFGLAVAYIFSIWLAVWAIDAFGVVNILGTGLYAPAAVYVVGLTLVIRDFLGDAFDAIGLRRWVMFLVIIIGAAVSAVVSPALALASGAAFLIAETLDWLVYLPVRERFGQVRGVLASNAVSIPVDSLIFLTLAFGSLQFFWGQVVGKAIATAVAVVVIVLVRAVRRAR